MCGFIASFGQKMSQGDFKEAMDHLKRRGPDEGEYGVMKLFF